MVRGAIPMWSLSATPAVSSMSAHTACVRCIVWSPILCGEAVEKRISQARGGLCEHVGLQIITLCASAIASARRGGIEDSTADAVDR
jgi:hypothetical protein